MDEPMKGSGWDSAWSLTLRAYIACLLCLGWVGWHDEVYGRYLPNAVVLCYLLRLELGPT
jgi:hypothetical protein